MAPEWNVPTTGARASNVAHSPVEGAVGWCAWITSGPNVAKTCRTARRDHGRGSIGAFESLYGMSTGEPTETTHGCGGGVRVGATTRTSWSRPSRCSASSRTCTWTPPGSSHA